MFSSTITQQCSALPALSSAAPALIFVEHALKISSYSTQWFQMSKIRQNINSSKVISRVFPWKFLQIHITSVSGCLCFTFKTRQTVAGTSTISIESRFWRFFTIRPNCGSSPQSPLNHFLSSPVPLLLLPLPHFTRNFID